MTKRSYLILAIAVVAATFAIVYQDRLPAFDDLKSDLDALLRRVEQSPIGFRLTFFVAYAGIIALSIPAGSIMTLAGGALFGLFEGAVIVSFASSLGALLAFLATRYLVRGILRQRFETTFRSIDKGIERDGRLYLFSLRTIPVFPFFLVNIAMGLTRIRAWTFYWVSQIGMLPATILFVNAGSRLADIDNPSEIASPGVLMSFALLGVFPWVSKAVFGLYQRSRLYAPFARPKRFDRNVVVIGAGAAGLVSAYIAAAARAKVTLVEAHKMGGDCLNYGCVPSKALIASAKLAHRMRHADRYGLIPAPGAFNFRATMARIGEVIAEIAP
ncbi:MAG: VTT domain-containing protein, partial [Afipia sp.]|nr:VTT domain-containing protein [Afipia sp.]